MLYAISICRTGVLGGRVEECPSCNHTRTLYNSCRNRHCPKCQCIPREEWILKREAELLPVPYYHVVFTIPDALNSLCRKHPDVMYNILFRSAWETIKVFAKDPKYLGAKSGMTSILHTWGQTMSLHPHLHCIVPGGGLTKSGKWINAKSEGKFLFPVKAMSSVFRAKFVEALRKEAKCNNIVIDDAIFKQLFAKKWVVYAKRPFLGPGQVIEYLGRYTHKIAISNYRITNVTNTHVTFSYKDYRQGGQKKSITLTVQEFIRRFSMHILPSGFMRIRHYGFLGSRFKKENLQKARESLGIQHVPPKVLTKDEICLTRLGFDMIVCPQCEQCAMVHKETIPGRKRAPPAFLDQTIPGADRSFFGRE